MVSNAVSQSFARKVEAEGVTVAEWVFLRLLYDAKDIAPSALAGRMGMTRGAVSKLTDRLADKSLVTRVADPRDKRAQTLVLTGAGRALVPRLAKLADANDAEFFAVLAAKERQALEAALRKIVNARDLVSVPVD
jgi:DNA-binding MarR family transcriptional regulator